MNHQERDKVIDGWRGLSVLMVIFDHAIRFRFGPMFPTFRLSELRSMSEFSASSGLRMASSGLQKSWVRQGSKFFLPSAVLLLRPFC